MYRVLVTGGAGFIGSHLARQLFEMGWQVDVVDDLSSGSETAFGDLDARYLTTNILGYYTDNIEPGDHKRLRFIAGDFAHPAVIRRIDQNKYRYIFHLAAIPRVAYSVQHPYETAETNLLKSIRLFEAAALAGGVRVVFSSSSSVYGNASVRPTGESIVKIPRSPYALQKLQCEEHARLFRDLHGLDFIALRYFNVYGPGQLGSSPYSTAIAAWCNAVSAGMPLRSDGDGTQSRDLTFVRDVVQANIKAALASAGCAGQSYNVASGKPISNNEILQMFRERYGDKIRVVNAPFRAGDVMHTHADPARALLHLGFQCETNFIDGLRETFEWWETRKTGGDA